MLSRRDAMVRLGQLGLGAVTLPGLLQAERLQGNNDATGSRPKGKARSCIFIFLWGGPPHQDLWDLKPEAPEGIRSLFRPIRTVVPGIQVCDQMPLFARHTDKVAIIRSMTHESNNHEPSVYHTLTGKRNPGLVVPANQRRRSDFPNLAAVLARFSPPGALPASVTLPRPIGHDGVTYAGTYAGFLGPRYDPLEYQEAPNSHQPALHAWLPPPDLQETRLLARRGLLRSLNELDRRLQHHRGPIDFDEFTQQAYRMLTSSAAKRAFQLELEPAVIRDRYGRNEYGESFLLARRLVEAGVRLVSINWMYIANGRVFNVWDNHGDTAGLGYLNGYAMLKEKYCIPPLDQAYSALLEDLAQRGLLEETLVVMVGEFGRTPRINKTLGRDHWGMCYSAVLAGGGIRGGQVYGASDAHAAYVKDKPVAPEDLLATIYAAFGLSPEAEIHDREHRPHRICDGRPLEALFG